MKRVIMRALLKAAGCFLIITLLTIGFQYVIWLRYEPENRMNIIPNSTPETISRKQALEYNHAIDKVLGIPDHFIPDLWPFNRPMMSVW